MGRKINETYSQYITCIAKAQALRERDERWAAKKAAKAAYKARRIAIQPQLDELSKRADEAFFNGTFADQRAVDAEIDALLASIA
jgi:fructose-bisphosphate aldolase class 1